MPSDMSGNMGRRDAGHRLALTATRKHPQAHFLRVNVTFARANAAFALANAAFASANSGLRAWMTGGVPSTSPGGSDTRVT
jgi:hypothetical protein